MFLAFTAQYNPKQHKSQSHISTNLLEHNRLMGLSYGSQALMPENGFHAVTDGLDSVGSNTNHSSWFV